MVTETITDTMTNTSASSSSGELIVIVIAVILVIVIWRAALKINAVVFRRIRKRRGESLIYLFSERIVSAVLTIMCFLSLFGTENLKSSILGSAAIAAAVIGFAGQDVIKDVLGGLQISLYRPFDIGSRVELPDGTAGIVEDITMRHVVIVVIDTVRVIVPNSKINEMIIRNYSYQEVPRSIQFKYPISYDSDIEKARSVIAEAVKAAPCAIPGKKLKDGSMSYAPVYFLSVEDSALIMSVTVYYTDQFATEVVKDMINTRVFAALAENGIEIPYNYLNVVMRK